MKYVPFAIMFALLFAGMGLASVDITMVDVVSEDQQSTSSQKVAVFFTIKNNDNYERDVMVEAYLRPQTSGLYIQGGEVMTEMPSGSICVPANTRYVGSARVKIPAKSGITGYLMPKVPPEGWKSQPNGVLRSCANAPCKYYAQVAVYTGCGGTILDSASSGKTIQEVPIQCSPQNWNDAPNSFGGGCKIIEPGIVTVDQTVSPVMPDEIQPDNTKLKETTDNKVVDVPASEEMDATVISVNPTKTEAEPGQSVPINFIIKNTGDVEKEFLIEGYLRKEVELMQIITYPSVPYSLCVPEDTQFVSGMRVKLAPGETSGTLTLSPVMPKHPYYAGGIRRDSSSYKAQIAVYEDCGKPVLGAMTSDKVINDATMKTSFAKGFAVVGAIVAGFAGLYLFGPYGAIVGAIAGGILLGLGGAYI